MLHQQGQGVCRVAHCWCLHAKVTVFIAGLADELACPFLAPLKLPILVLCVKVACGD